METSMSLTHPRLIRFIVFIVALLFALPILIGLRSMTEADVQRLYNRSPTELPDPREIVNDPPAALQRAVQYFSERIAGVAFMTKSVQQMRFTWLKDPGSPLIARSRELVFLSAFDTAAPPMDNIRNSCRVGDGRNTALWLQKLIENTQFVHSSLDTAALKIGFLIIPSKPVVYYDRLPKGTPASIRSLCAQSAVSGELEHWMVEMEEANIAASYPLALFTTKRIDPAYYPAANFHAEGESAHDAALSLLDKMFPDREPWPQARFKTAHTDADLEFILTFPRKAPMRVPDYGLNAAYLDQPATIQLREKKPAFRAVSVYTTLNSIVGGDALIIGNSFARHATPNFAPFFDKTIVFDMASATDPELTTALTELIPSADVVIFIVQDTAAKYWLWQRERDALEALDGRTNRTE
jgi:hypothetical protein